MPKKQRNGRTLFEDFELIEETTTCYTAFFLIRETKRRQRTYVRTPVQCMHRDADALQSQMYKVTTVWQGWRLPQMVVQVSILKLEELILVVGCSSAYGMSFRAFRSLHSQSQLPH